MITLKRSEVRIGDIIFYDVFPVSAKKIIAIGPFTKTILGKFVATERECGISSTEFHIIEDRHQHTLIASFTFPEDVLLSKNKIYTLLFTDGHNSVECNVVREEIEPSPTSMSTLTIEDPDYILKWIEYNKEVIGVERFYIYSNTEESFLRFNEAAGDSALSSMIISILWDVPYRFPGNSISGQTTQQNHSIYRFNNDDIIGLFDVDEYIIPVSGNVLDIVKDIIDETVLIHRDTAQNIKPAAVSLQCLIFGCGNNKSVDSKSFLKRMNLCAEKIEKKWERQKCFVSPKKVDVFSVHTVVEGGITFCLPPTISYFNHYYYIGKNLEDCNCIVYCAKENEIILKLIN